MKQFYIMMHGRKNIKIIFFIHYRSSQRCFHFSVFQDRSTEAHTSAATM